MEMENCEMCKRLLPVFNHFVMRPTNFLVAPVLEDQLYVVLQPDPFAFEIHDDSTPHWLCQECCYERYMGV